MDFSLSQTDYLRITSEILLKIALFPTHPNFIVPVLCLAYLLFGDKQRRLVNLIFSFLFINGALNVILKFLFKVPLDPSLKNQCWYAFPSGHMQYGIAFWGTLWINSCCKKIALLVFSAILIISGYSMSWHHYHNLYEMLAAVPSAAVVLVAYYFVHHKIDLGKSNLLILNSVALAIQVFTIWLVESPCIGFKFGWLWLNVGATVGLMITSVLCNSPSSEEISIDNILKKIKSWKMMMVAVLGILAVLLLKTFLLGYNSNLLSFICGVLVIGVLYLFSKLK